MGVPVSNHRYFALTCAKLMLDRVPLRIGCRLFARPETNGGNSPVPNELCLVGNRTIKSHAGQDSSANNDVIFADGRPNQHPHTRSRPAIQLLREVLCPWESRNPYLRFDRLLRLPVKDKIGMAGRLDRRFVRTSLSLTCETFCATD